jgi:hypothetical protein
MTTLSNGHKILLFLIFFLFPQSFFSRDRTWAAYKILLYLAPQLKNVLDDPDPTSLNTFLSQVSFSSRSSFYCLLNKLLFKLQEGANGARSDDIKHIKEELGTWINLDYKPIKPLDPKTRDGRGLQHDVCGGLLTPIQFDWQDNDDEQAHVLRTYTPIFTFFSLISSSSPSPSHS